jgi:hypothetical protein
MMVMKWMRVIGAPCLSLVIASGSAFAQDVDDELTISVIRGPQDLPAVVTHAIILPDSAAEEGVTNSARGVETANANRLEAAARREEALQRAEESRQAGLDRAAGARERGADLGAELSEEARGNRENFVRGEGLELSLPDHLPALPDRAPAELPTLPDLPALPDVPRGGPNS